MQILLLTLRDRNQPEGPNNLLEVRKIDIDQSQVSCSVWGETYSTLHACALVDGEVKQIRAVVKHEHGDPHLVKPIELETVYWNCCEEVGGLIKYVVKDTISSL